MRHQKATIKHLIRSSIEFAGLLLMGYGLTFIPAGYWWSVFSVTAVWWLGRLIDKQTGGYDAT